MRLASCRSPTPCCYPPEHSQSQHFRALDAIHVAAAVDLSPLDCFASQDERQAAAARLSGMRTLSLGG
jgi:hypothetical protein